MPLDIHTLRKTLFFIVSINPLFASGPLLSHYMDSFEYQKATFRPLLWTNIIGHTGGRMFLYTISISK